MKSTHAIIAVEDRSAITSAMSNQSKDIEICGLTLDEIAIWLWVIGCTAFSSDALLYIYEEITPHGFLYLTGSVLFLIGCIIWLIDLRKKK